MLSQKELIDTLCNADLCNGNEQLQDLRSSVTVEEAERIQRIAGTEKAPHE